MCYFVWICLRFFNRMLSISIKFGLIRNLKYFYYYQKSYYLNTFPSVFSTTVLYFRLCIIEINMHMSHHQFGRFYS
jgi:hypothetical protein